MDRINQGAKRTWSAFEHEHIPWQALDEQDHQDFAKRPRQRETSEDPAQSAAFLHATHCEWEDHHQRYFQPPQISSNSQYLSQDFSAVWASQCPVTNYNVSMEPCPDVALPQFASQLLPQLASDSPTPNTVSSSTADPQIFLDTVDTARNVDSSNEIESLRYTVTSEETPSEEDDNCVENHDTCFGIIQTSVPGLRLSDLGDIDSKRIDVILKINGRLVTVRNCNTLAYGGLITGETADVLVDLTETFDIAFNAYLLLSKEKRKKAPEYEFCIAILGAGQDAYEIGARLGDLGVFLQTPQGYHPSVPYFNPQYLRRPGTESSGSRITDLSELLPKSSRILPDNDPLKHQVLRIFDDAQGPSTCTNVQQSARLKTLLKDHQLKALAMMREKEKGNLEYAEFGTMWSPIAQPDGSVRYRNTVVPFPQISKPTVCRGGLLADDMGLGKTLSVLALIATYLDYMDNAGLVQDDVHPKMTTLIICPLSLLLTWEDQIKSHIHPRRVSYHIYHGPGRQKPLDELRNYHVILTTYDTIAAEGRKDFGKIAKVDKGLLSLEWGRIVLDEAHLIRNATSQRHRALQRLKARHRWCLTGSPIFNRVEDFGSLLSFLRAAPFHDLSFFNTHISNPLKRDPEKALETLRKLVRSVSLRRTKASVFGELHLPPRETRTQEVALDSEERQLYEVLQGSYRMILERSAIDDSSPCIFGTILRLRQFCDHGLDLLPRSAMAVFEDSVDGAAITNELMSASQACASCKKAIVSSQAEVDVDYKLDCQHRLCSRCEKQEQESLAATSTSCRFCSKARTPEALSPSPYFADRMDLDAPYTPSSKVKALLNNLQAERNEATHPQIKSVIFSCWTRMLDQIGKALQTHDLRFERIDGSCQPHWPANHVLYLLLLIHAFFLYFLPHHTPIPTHLIHPIYAYFRKSDYYTYIAGLSSNNEKTSGVLFLAPFHSSKSDSQRRSALELFRTQDDCCILLASIGSAGVGLDLTVASRVHLMEPQWSPMAEEQALDRVHRMGQTRDVVATRYVVKGSIEEYVISVQELKSRVIKQSFEGGAATETLTARERLMKYLERSSLPG